LSKERLFPAEVGVVPGKSPNAVSKSLKVATFWGSGIAENGGVEAEKGLLSFAGTGGKGLVLWVSVPSTPAVGENAASTVV
jgi:hypothetical protein